MLLSPNCCCGRIPVGCSAPSAPETFYITLTFDTPDTGACNCASNPFTFAITYRGLQPSSTTKYWANFTLTGAYSGFTQVGDDPFGTCVNRGQQMYIGCMVTLDVSCCWTIYIGVQLEDPFAGSFCGPWTGNGSSCNVFTDFTPYYGDIPLTDILCDFPGTHACGENTLNGTPLLSAVIQE